MQAVVKQKQKKKMDAILALKRASAPQNFKSFKELAVGEYIARKFAVIKSTFGKRVRVYIDDYYVYLPERHAIELDENLIELLNNNMVLMRYSGKDRDNHNRLIIDFELMKIDIDGEMVVVAAPKDDDKEKKE